MYRAQAHLEFRGEIPYLPQRRDLFAEEKLLALKVQVLGSGAVVYCNTLSKRQTLQRREGHTLGIGPAWPVPPRLPLALHRSLLHCMPPEIIVCRSFIYVVLHMESVRRVSMKVEKVDLEDMTLAARDKAARGFLVPLFGAAIRAPTTTSHLFH